MNRTRATGFVLLGLFVALPVACSDTPPSGGGTPDPSATTTSTIPGLPPGPTATGTATDASVPDSAPPPECVKPEDCPSKICLPTNKCAIASLTDGVQNNDETDVDCGGISKKVCDDGQKCLTRLDCASGVCKDKADGQGLRCQAPSPTDLTRNGTETDIDCGGPAAPKCGDALRCGDKNDCTSGVCVGNVCQAPAIDGQKNGTETDVDCGGPTAPACANGKGCGVANDCTSRVCTGMVCQAPSPTDGVKNGTETDVDCGGAAAPKCGVTKVCAVNADCASDGCAYDLRCTARASCTARNGGDTCGRGEVGQPGATHESCCATAPVPGAPGVHLGKYGVTAGRMRVFLDRIGGNVRGFIQSARAAGKIPANAPMAAAWDPYLPVSFGGNTLAPPAELAEGSQNDAAPIPGVYTSVYRHLGGFIFRANTQSQTGCYNYSPGTHTYWMPAAIETQYMNDNARAYGQDILDTKGLNCVNYLMAQAFCIWDGGRLQTTADYNAAWGASSYPWGATPAPKGQGSATYAGNRFPTATDASLRAVGGTYAPSASQSIEYANFLYSYEYPNLIGTDYAVFIGAPGRLRGRSGNGHSLNDGLMEITGTISAPTASTPFGSTMTWAKNGSFEGHGIGGTHSSHLLNKYGKLGFRCAYTTP
ncbi:MAG: hypothetical protein IPF92_20760 [Myxococcales bacterium]|nr:hypothetical protein [Myxococcales bacterium]